MILKKDKEQVLSEIRENVRSTISSRLSNTNMGLSIDPSSLVYQLQNAIALGIEEGFRTLLENRYTDDDFEKDITLK